MSTLLDLPEQRFPLNLDVAIPKVRSLYHAATRLQWDPKVDIPWDQFDRSKYTKEQLDAARLYWSRRAWGEYGAISESPALLIRFCQERREPDLALFFAIRTQEESRHAETCCRFAELMGGYISAPPGFDAQAAIESHGVRKMALDPETPLEAIIASLVCAAEEIAFDTFAHLVEITTDPVARAVLATIKRDEVRHCAFGWAFMDARVPSLAPDELGRVKDAVEQMIQDVYCKGYQSWWLAPDSEATRRENQNDRIVYEAGLGQTVEELEIPIFFNSLKRIREAMQPWGFTLKEFYHPKIGVA